MMSTFVWVCLKGCGVGSEAETHTVENTCVLWWWVFFLLCCRSKKVYNLGVAANTLCHDLMAERLTEHRKATPLSSANFHYFPFEGLQATSKKPPSLFLLLFSFTVVCRHL